MLRLHQPMTAVGEYHRMVGWIPIICILSFVRCRVGSVLGFSMVRLSVCECKILQWCSWDGIENIVRTTAKYKPKYKKIQFKAVQHAENQLLVIWHVESIQSWETYQEAVDLGTWGHGYQFLRSALIEKRHHLPPFNATQKSSRHSKVWRHCTCFWGHGISGGSWFFPVLSQDQKVLLGVLPWGPQIQTW